ncbi:unnamed protein product [Alternaria alternata]
MANTHIGYRKPLQPSGTYSHSIGLKQSDLQPPVSIASLDLAIVCKNLRKLDMTFHVDKVSICNDATNRVPFLRSSIASNWRQFSTVEAWTKCILTAYTSDHRYTIRLNPKPYFPPNVTPMAYFVFEQISGIDHLFKSQREAMRCIEQYAFESQVNEQSRLFIPKSCVENNHLYDATMIEFIAITGAATSATAWVYELEFHKFPDLPPELRLNVRTHSLSTVVRCGCGTNTDSVGTILTRYDIELTPKTSDQSLTKIMEVFQFLFYLWLLFTDVAIAIANITVANLLLPRSMSHLLIPSNAKRLRNTYFGLETAFTTDEMIAILASLHPTQSQESLLETLVRCKGSIEQAKEVLAEEVRANAPRIFVGLTLSSPVIKPENIDDSRKARRSARLEVSVIALHHTLPCSFTLSRTALWDLQSRKNKEGAYSNLIQSFWLNQPPVGVYRNFRGDFLKIVRIDNDFNRHNPS